MRGNVHLRCECESPRPDAEEQEEPLRGTRMETKPMAGESCRGCGDTHAPRIKAPYGQEGMGGAKALLSFRGGGGARWRMSA